MCYTPGPQHGWFGASLDKTQHFSVTSANLTVYLVACMEILQICSSMSRFSIHITCTSAGRLNMLLSQIWCLKRSATAHFKDNKHFRPLQFSGASSLSWESLWCCSFLLQFSNRTEPHRGCLCAGFTINCTYNPDFIRACTRVSFLCDPALRCLKSGLWGS